MRYFGLIGYPLGHSFSKSYFTAFFEKNNIDACYDLYPIENINKLPELLQTVELTGLNVTIPYKEKVIPFLDELDETASAIGAVNVIKFTRNADKTILKGYNSDTIGFENAIRPFLKPHHRRALILGTGGASKAIVYTLKKLGIDTSYVSRNASADILCYEDLNKETLNKHSLIINTTPLGMYPKTDACPAIPYQFLTPDHVLYDLVYRPEETLFMKKGKENGAVTVNGLEMLYGQAIASWQIWAE